MANELAYAWITPYSLLKSRTGGIIGRLMSMADLTLVGVRMFAPSDEFVDAYADTISDQEDLDPQLRDAFITYLNDYFKPENKLDIPNRTMLLVFEGPNAVEVMKEEVAGPITSEPRGDNIRGTYGDYIRVPEGEIRYFEPAVLIGTSTDQVNKHLALFSQYSATDGGVLEDLMSYPEGENAETTLVILKPENFKKQSSRPGNIIDMFSRTGLYIVGAKMLHMSVAQAERFYGPLRSMFVNKLKGIVVSRLENSLGDIFDFEVSERQFEAMGDILADNNAEYEFNKIVEYMSGKNPKDMSQEDKQRPGEVTALALLYQGVNAIEKIRTTLGATNPAKASPGTVRSAYANDLMRNAAHASDSPENALREREIIDLMPHERVNDIREIIDSYLAERAG